MAMRLKEVITAGLWILLIAVAWFSFCGCAIDLTDKGSVFLKFGTTIEIGHETSTTHATSQAKTSIAGEFLRSLGLWKENGEVKDEEQVGDDAVVVPDGG